MSFQASFPAVMERLASSLVVSSSPEDGGTRLWRGEVRLRYNGPRSTPRKEPKEASEILGPSGSARRVECPRHRGVTDQRGTNIIALHGVAPTCMLLERTNGLGQPEADLRHVPLQRLNGNDEVRLQKHGPQKHGVARPGRRQPMKARTTNCLKGT